jgi:hypothetical protein
VLGIFSWSHYWIYVIATLLSGSVAARAFLYIQPAERVRSSGSERPLPQFVNHQEDRNVDLPPI